MKIPPSGSPAPPTRGREVERGRRAAGSGFARQMDPAAAGAPGVGLGGPLAALGSVLSAQEVEDTPPERGRAIARGHDLLDGLQTLHRDLIEGAAEGNTVERLAALVDEPRTALDDPALERVLQEVELRAAVELAKRGTGRG